MASDLKFEGKCWKFGDNVTTDAIVPTHTVFMPMEEMAKHVLASANSDFPKQVEAGDIIVGGRNFGCSSGRAIAPKAIKATGVSVVVAEFFSRTFYRNGYEVGLPILEADGITQNVETGDRLRIDVENAVVENLTTGRVLKATPPPELLLNMLRAGGLISYMKSDANFVSGSKPR